jgi:inorganic pyrophosphatase
MADLSAFPNRWDRKKGQCCAIIETPKNRRNKFDYDPESNLFKLGGLLPEGMMLPFNFGFIPSTLGGDGDPLDVMVLMDEPAHVGCLVDFVSYNKLRGKKFKLKNQGGPKRTMTIIAQGIQAFKKKS